MEEKVSDVKKKVGALGKSSQIFQTKIEGHENEAFSRHCRDNHDGEEDNQATVAIITARTDAKQQKSNADDASQQQELCVEATEIEELVEEIQDLHPNANSFDGNDDSSVLQHNIFIDDSNNSTFVKHSIIIICDVSKLLTPVGLVKIVIMVSCIVSLACICATDYPALVLSGYARFHIFSLTFTFLTVLVIFMLEILTLLLLFPVHWERWNAFIHLVVSLLLVASSTFLMHSLIKNESWMPRLDITVELIVIAVLAGYFSGMLCLLISVMACCCYEHHMTLPWKQHPEGILMLK